MEAGNTQDRIITQFKEIIIILTIFNNMDLDTINIIIISRCVVTAMETVPVMVMDMVTVMVTVMLMDLVMDMEIVTRNNVIIGIQTIFAPDMVTE